MEISSSSHAHTLERPTAHGELDASDRKRVQELQRRDREVRAHEQAHMAAAGAHANGGPTYQYERGPDGKLYATSGEVSVDTSPVAGDPQATIRKMQQIKRAALAPDDPSGADRGVAAQAARQEQRARTEAREESESPGEGYGATDPAQARGSLIDLVA